MSYLTLDASPEWLISGEIVGIGRVPAGSNATFAIAIRDGDEERLAIYKPKAGERPLWDFPEGTLYRREVATYLVSQALGWGIVPATVQREGPYGVGSMQVYCEPDQTIGFRELQRRRSSDLLRIALFDIVTNNADRKVEHCLPACDGNLYAIDNGLSFHTEFKNRTVLVDFAGKAIPTELLDDLAFLADDTKRRDPLDRALAELLDDDEITCIYDRIAVVRKVKKIPRALPHWELYYGVME